VYYIILAVHLENGQRVYYNEQNAHERIKNVKNTTLMAFFELCTRNDFAKTLLYIEVILNNIIHRNYAMVLDYG